MTDLAGALLAESTADQRIDDSSFGTPGARALRARTAPEVADKIVDNVDSGSATTWGAIHARLASSTFHELVEAALTGDPGATGTLFVWIHPVVVRYCRARIGKTGQAYAAADDVAQEVCLAVLGALPRYDEAPQSFLPFVYGMCAHKVADYYRRIAHVDPKNTSDVPDGLELTPEQHAKREQRARMIRVLDTLAPRAREILILRLVVGLSAQETAAAVGLTATAVRVAQHRALAKLRASASATEWL